MQTESHLLRVRLLLKCFPKIVFLANLDWRNWTETLIEINYILPGLEKYLYRGCSVVLQDKKGSH